MKRSEMIERLVKVLKTEKAYPYRGPWNIAEDLMGAIEDAGMLPPPYYDSFYHDEPECDGMVPEWEPEDD